MMMMRLHPTFLQIESLKKALGNKEIQTPTTKKTKEGAARTPPEKPKQMTERTPPRTRRLSIENGNTMALERSINYNDKRGAKTPSLKPKQLSDRTPPRPRRLSIENGATMNPDEKKGAKTPAADKTRSKRLSLEGPRNAQKDSNQMKSPEVRCLQNYSQLEDGKPITDNACGQKEHGRSLVELSNRTAPRSPLSSSAPKSPLMRIDTATLKVPSSYQIPKTPEPQIIKPRSEIQRLMQNDRIIGPEIKTPSTTHGKGSQIRKSLRTIGKLINGSEKR